MIFRQMLCLLVIIYAHFLCVLTFNLEARLPVIKRGAEGSYFGYSVAEHQALSEINGTLEHSWLLVGAPLDRNLQPGTNRSGALWRCPITTLERDCTQVVTDGKRNPLDGQYDSSVDSNKLMPPADDEIKDGQWLGVTVKSMGPGKKVMVCAHRYIRKGADYQWGLGLCYTLTERLDYDETWEPCKGRPTNRAHEDFGYCQAGTSGILVDDLAVIGSPGPYTWRGTVFVVSVADDFLNRDKNIYYGPMKELTSPVDKYSYLGMAVTAATFFGGKIAYAAGAPRANDTGQVVIFSKPEKRKKKEDDNEMDVKLILDGEQFASSFGYELTNADVNGDGYPDLIVGAPFYFGKAEGGAIYIYNNNEHHCLDCNKPVKLTGKPESRFGFAISNLKDLNLDGYEDIAVGAPYEGSGAVYIYLGSPTGLITEPAQVIRVEDMPSTIRPMRTLGYSLSGGMDLDANGYPDLLIGAYEQDAVVLLRARPIINIQTSVKPERQLRNIDPSQPGCGKDPNSNYTCFSFEACVKMKLKTDLTLNYSLEAETFQPGRKFSRVWFGGPDADKRLSVIRKKIELRYDPPRASRSEVTHCEPVMVYIKENARDIQSPIKFQLIYRLVQKEPPRLYPGQPLPRIDDYPVLNQQEAAKIFQATFQKDCGDNDICESQLDIMSHLLLPPARRPSTWELIMGEHQEVKLNVTANNFGESAYEAQLYVVHSASLSYISHKSDGKHLICTRFNKTLVICSLGNPFKQGTPANIQLRFDPKGMQDSEAHLEFVVFANSTSMERSPQAPVVLHTHVIRRAEISISGSVYPDHVFYGGAIKGESAMEYLDDIGEHVVHSYHIYNQGPWKVGSLDVRVEWPFQVANNKPQGKWLLYMEDRPVVEAIGGGECFVSENHINPLNLTRRPGSKLEAMTLLGGTVPPYLDELEPTAVEPHLRRRRRDTEMVVRAEAYLDKEGRRHEVVNMNCILGTAKCFKFHCTVFNLRKNQEATIRIRARLWNSTLVEDYPKVDSVKIKSRAKLHLPSGLMIHQNKSDDEAQVETVAYPDLLEQQEPEPVPIWIIIVAIVAGLLLLILLTLVLWKLGFFKRRRPDPTLSGNLEKHRDENGDYS